MGVPLKYNFRSLWVRRVATLMTALGIGLTVALVVVMLAMTRGLDSVFVETGRDDQIVVLREGSQNEVNSYFNRDNFDSVRFLPGIARDEQGEPLAAGEMIVVINHPRVSGEESNVVVRGVSETSFKLRPGLEIVEGRPFRQGVREIIVSRSLSRRFQDMQLGDSLEINRSPWKVVGIFEAGRSAYSSEIWADYEDVAQAWDRPIYSSVLLRAEGGEAFDSLLRRIGDDQRIQLDAVPQKEYFEQQTISSVPLKALGLFIAVIVGIGSCFAVMNMMYGTIMNREQEVATLRSLGFKRRSILASFLIEGAMLALLGGLIGCILGTLFHGYSVGTQNFALFSEVVFDFRITPDIWLWGLLFSLVVGLLGGFLPARRAATVKLTDVLRK